MYHVREFGLYPEGQHGSFEGFRQGSCIPLHLLLLFPLFHWSYSPLCVPAKAKVVLALGLCPWPSSAWNVL